MAYMITSVVEQAFFVYKACRSDHKLSEEQCLNLSQDTVMKQKVQLTVSDFHQWNNIAGHIVPIISALFIGNWSDQHGRKLPLLIGLFGKFIYSFMLVVNSLFLNWSVNMIIYTASFPMGLLGGDIAIFASCFAYISDVSEVEDRTLRIAILDIVYLSAMPIGIAFGSFLYYNVVNSSYTVMFSLNAATIFLSIVYSLCFLKWQTTTSQVPIWNRNVFLDFFDYHHVQATVKTLVKKRLFHGRTFLIIILSCMILYTFQRDEKPLSYLYTQLKFNWGIKEFSNFRTFYSTLFVIVSLISIPIMSKLLLFQDVTIVIIGALSHAVGRIIFFFAHDWQVFYLGGVAAALGPIAAPAIRSIASKIVSSKERGKLFSVLSVCDNAVPLLSGILYTQLYNATIKSEPGQIFWLTFATQILILLMMLAIRCLCLCTDRNNLQLCMNHNDKEI